ncbi:4-alpha-glucanotransferase [Pelagicoccus sp. SDUM812003]|uniref:4-alpha-glucanotransferase n=1 Tax=Pelagicoccus sp. SDUM812003 TaxID=3041267 RepID=UPI00280F748D|nr:4-alpha-glucanotransferase [Pelagicoccus sp. SDUM812003]MDQ8202907.1 4-alpha-glucanotransferase [Pelagicoccus sp. SDUM812003]
MSSSSSSWLDSRKAGVLAHVSSLPSSSGIGNMGKDARRFVDFLARAGFSYWQVCPLGPTGYGDSPYQSFSAFAGNPYFIDLEELVEVGLLKAEEILPHKTLPTSKVDYGALYHRIWDTLARAHDRFDSRSFRLPDSESFSEFIERNVYWIDDYTTFMAFKNRFDHKSWTEWPHQFRSPSAAAEQLATEWDRIEKSRHTFYQYLFFSQWGRLKRYANQRGVEIIGDMPIYVALDSADTWSRRRNFLMDKDGRLDSVAGVPPDYFSSTGQRWGNPLYDWEHLARTGYRWWIDRIRASLTLFDVLRFDHFRGFEDYWVVPADAMDASRGHWQDGPSLEFFQAIEDALPGGKYIAEDLGYINRRVFKLREATGYPGMKIMQFGFGHDDNNVNLPHFFSFNQVVYTGTHDNDTTQGWIDNLEGETRRSVFDYYDLHEHPRCDRLIDAAYGSVARLVVLPLQDILGLGSESRMNRPGTTTGNWQWRLDRTQLDELMRVHAPAYQKRHRRYHRIDDTAQRDFSAPPRSSVIPPKMSPRKARKTTPQAPVQPAV